MVRRARPLRASTMLTLRSTTLATKTAQARSWGWGEVRRATCSACGRHLLSYGGAYVLQESTALRQPCLRLIAR
jgi:hypothetical protein